MPKELNSPQDIEAFLLKQAAIVKGMSIRIDAAIQELAKVRAKFFAANLAKGFAPGAVAEFEKAQKSAQMGIQNLDVILARAKQAATRAATLLKR